MIRLCIFGLLYMALIVPQIEAQAPKDKKEVTVDHLDALEKVMKEGFAKAEKKQDAQDLVLEKHGKKLDQILANQLLLANQIKNGFEGLGAQVADVKKVAEQKVNIVNNIYVPPAPPAPTPPAPMVINNYQYPSRGYWWPGIPVYDYWGNVIGYR